MRLSELFENETGRDDYHPENYYAPIVAKLINDTGFAYWDDIYQYVEKNVDLSGADLAKTKGGVQRYKKIINNLHHHRTLEGGKFGDIVRISGGLAMRKTAEELNIEISDDNSIRPRNPGKRGAMDIRKKVGTIVKMAYDAAGKPKLKDKSATRKAIEDMVKVDPWRNDSELMDKAKEIISRG